ICEKHPGCPGRTYGENCSLSCSPNCGGPSKKCYDNGSCIDGCADGFLGDQCKTACSKYMYGAKCAYMCSTHCRGRERTCRHNDGRCDYGCHVGYDGPKCDIMIESAPVSANGNRFKVFRAILLVAFLVAFIVSIAVITLLLYTFKEKDGANKEPSRTSSSQRRTTDSASVEVISVSTLSIYEYGSESSQVNRVDQDKRVPIVDGQFAHGREAV
ncbi:hypothetical protein EGW08_001671, partial [Elysia chlorotica]